MIKEKDGIHIHADQKIVADSRQASGDLNFVSHAHFDHLTRDSTEVICSEETARIGEVRAGEEIEFTEHHEKIELLNSGHIIGSRAALVESDQTILYTGDVSTRDRLYIDGFEPVEADILVVESTYGIPTYSFPPQSKVEKRVKSWIEEKNEEPLILFGYSLGKAQKIQKIVEETTERPVLAHGAVRKMNKVVEDVSELSFRAKPYGENRQLMSDNGILVAPSRSSQSDWVEKLVNETGGLKAGFSGWAATDSFRHRGGYDMTFQLSDHCGFQELVSLVKQVDPEKVYTHHGFDEAFASHLSRELGYSARPLKKNQSTLEDF